ncbi:MAG: hypothetical protein GY792_13755, partial [Gammaproteobacteria bacterium]|nr:hypothetical protein [Gammaproteobacteria bacterium]
QRKAGDPWTVEDFHELQTMVKGDIRGSIRSAIDEIEQVAKARDADKFGGKNPEEYAKAIVDRVLAELPKRTGYQMLFKDLKVSEESVVNHQLGAFPLVDLYQLDYFRVIASEDDHIYETFTTFYLYHSSESKIRFRPEETPTAPSVSLPIDPEDGHVYRIPFYRMLELYDVKYDDDMSLGDLENEFWQAFLSDPNDDFDDDQYCHSPWFDRCCREMRTVQYLKRRGNWDDMWFQVHPQKTVNYPNDDPTWRPNQIGVAHFDLNTLGLMLLKTPDLPASQTDPVPLDELYGGQDAGEGEFPPPQAVRNDHLKVMALLKV